MARRRRDHRDHRGAQRVQPRPAGRTTWRGRGSTPSASGQTCDPPLARAARDRPDEFVLVYHGTVHYANQHEMLSLYLAVKLLQRRGRPVRLVRLGEHRAGRRRPARRSRALRDGVLELGAVGWREIPGLPRARRRLRAARRRPTTSTATGCPRSCRSSWPWAGPVVLPELQHRPRPRARRERAAARAGRRARDRGAARAADRTTASCAGDSAAARARFALEHLSWPAERAARSPTSTASGSLGRAAGPRRMASRSRRTTLALDELYRGRFPVDALSLRHGPRLSRTASTTSAAWRGPAGT